MSSVPIVVVAYNRPGALSRLLRSLSLASYPQDQKVDLYITFDGGADQSCVSIARGFQWQMGEKHLVEQQEHLGLKKHIIRAGDISVEHGAAIVLEDDLIVAPGFYHYAIAATEFYKESVEVAAIALYSYRINEFCNYPFEPIMDGWDAFFMKVPCSWGEVFLRDRWNEFKVFAEVEEPLKDTNVPGYIQNSWSASSWKKAFYKYLIEQNKFVAYPSFSYTDTPGDIGTNHKHQARHLSTSLSTSVGPFRFPTREQTLNVYDQFMELDSSLMGRISEKFENCECDIYGLKPLRFLTGKRILTSRNVSEAEITVPLWQSPIQSNVILNFDGDSEVRTNLSLANVGNVTDQKENLILDIYFGERVSPKTGAYHSRIGSQIQRDYWVSKPLIRMFLKIKKWFRGLRPKS